MPTLGGAERPIATARTRDPGLSWSPDGSLLAFTHRESSEEPDGVFLASRSTGATRRLTKPPPDHLLGDGSPRFSPDGRSLAFVRASVVTQTDVYLVPVAGGEPRRLTSGNHQTAGLAWAPDSRSVVFSSSRSPRAGFFGLWRVSASGGEPELLEFGEQGGRARGAPRPWATPGPRRRRPARRAARWRPPEGPRRARGRAGREAGSGVPGLRLPPSQGLAPVDARGRRGAPLVPPRGARARGPRLLGPSRL